MDRLHLQAPELLIEGVPIIPHLIQCIGRQPRHLRIPQQKGRREGDVQKLTANSTLCLPPKAPYTLKAIEQTPSMVHQCLPRCHHCASKTYQLRAISPLRRLHRTRRQRQANSTLTRLPKENGQEDCRLHRLPHLVHKIDDNPRDERRVLV